MGLAIRRKQDCLRNILKIGKKVFNAQNEKIPLIVTVGEKEESANTVAVRTSEGKVHFGLNTDEFLKKILENIKEKKIKVEL